MHDIISVARNDGVPQYFYLDDGRDEVVLSVETGEKGKAMVAAMVNALGRRSYDAEGRPRQDERFARAMIERGLIDDEQDYVVLPHAGAVALRGALEEFAETYGEGRNDGLITADFLAVTAQLSAHSQS